MTGIIYQYTSPRGKIYVGQTTDEKNRRSSFLDKTQVYAGKKMEDERKKCPKLNDWKYRVLQTVKDDDKDRLKEKLTFLEAYYIIQFNSILDGLNTYLADIDTICTNRYLKNYYCVELKNNPYGQLEVLRNIDPYLFRMGPKKFYYSETAYVNDQLWLDEIRKRYMTVFHTVTNCDRQKCLERFSKYRKNASLQSYYKSHFHKVV